MVVVSPLKVRRYAGAIGQLAKTDAIDARLIARFGVDLKPVVPPPCDMETPKIKDLMVRRRQLTTMRTMEKNRRQIMPKSCRPSIDQLVHAIEEQIKALQISDSTWAVEAARVVAAQTRPAHHHARHRQHRGRHPAR